MSRCKLAACALMDELKTEIQDAVGVTRLKRTSTPPIIIDGGELYEEITIVIGVVRKNALEV